MKLTINNEFDPEWEIMGLLKMYFNPDEYSREKYDSNFLELGIRNNKVVEEAYSLGKLYSDAFSQKAIAPDEDSFFFTGHMADGTSLHLLLGLVFEQNENWLNGLDAVSEDEVFSSLSMVIFEHVPQSFSEIFDLLQEISMEPEQAWRMMLVLKSPKEYLGRFFNLINNNKPAYLFAMSKIKDKIEPLLEQFETSCAELIKSDSKFITPFTANSEVTIIPTILTGLVFSVKSAYIGLHFPETYKLMNRFADSEADLVPMLKALSDSSKFEILKFLRSGPKYSLELAKHLDITPATASHHMNVLFSLGLVTVEKEKKKIYYTLNEKQLKKITEGLISVFGV